MARFTTGRSYDIDMTRTDEGTMTFDGWEPTGNSTQNLALPGSRTRRSSYGLGLLILNTRQGPIPSRQPTPHRTMVRHHGNQEPRITAPRKDRRSEPSSGTAGAG